MADDVPLKAFAGRQVLVSCGCRVLVAVERRIDLSVAGALYDVGPPELLVVPCGAGLEHLALARALSAEGGMREPEDLAEALEEALADTLREGFSEEVPR